MTKLTEWQFDGLVGPTHHYGGLSSGNIASTSHKHLVSSPKAAALQGLEKMRFVSSLGVQQAFLPPNPRPNLSLLRSLGFHGTVGDILAQAYEQAPHRLSQAYSASSMWTANAATISPSSDTCDNLLHITPANLISKVHRAQEASFSYDLMRRIFHDAEQFCVHQPIFGHADFGDEGAANHTRLFSEVGTMQIFGYGIDTMDPTSPRPAQYVARQTRQASEALIRNANLKCAHILAHQDPYGIDAGSFHSDVLMVGTGSVLLIHEHAFLQLDALLKQLRHHLGQALEVHIASKEELPTADAVKAYPFNSQLLLLDDGSYIIIAPSTCLEVPSAHAWLEKVKSTSQRIRDVHYLDVKQSMQNGGGPACLRLRVPMTTKESESFHPGVILTEPKSEMIERWIRDHYRDELSLPELASQDFYDEVVESLKALEDIIQLPGLYASV